MNTLRISLIVALIVLPTLFGFLKMPTEMGLAIGAIGISLFFANLEKFVRFKGAGFEAELRTAVDKTYAALEELKELALCLTGPIVDELAISGRMLEYIHLKHKLERVQEIAETLRKLGASESEIEDACSTLHQRVTKDHVKRVFHSLRGANPEKEKVFQDVDDSKGFDWSPESTQRFINQHELKKNEDTNDAISDLDYFLAHRRLKREDKWQS